MQCGNSWRYLQFGGLFSQARTREHSLKLHQGRFGWISGRISSWQELLNMRMDCPGWCSLYRALHDVLALALLGSWSFIFLELLHSLTLCNVRPRGTQGNFVCRRIILQISEELSKIIRKFFPCLLWLLKSQKSRYSRIKVWKTFIAVAQEDCISFSQHHCCVLNNFTTSSPEASPEQKGTWISPSPAKRNEYCLCAGILG